MPFYPPPQGTYALSSATPRTSQSESLKWPRRSKYRMYMASRLHSRFEMCHSATLVMLSTSKKSFDISATILLKALLFPRLRIEMVDYIEPSTTYSYFHDARREKRLANRILRATRTPACLHLTWTLAQRHVVSHRTLKRNDSST